MRHEQVRSTACGLALALGALLSPSSEATTTTQPTSLAPRCFRNCSIRIAMLRTLSLPASGAPEQYFPMTEFGAYTVIPNGASDRLSVFSATGRLVRTVPDESQPPLGLVTSLLSGPSGLLHVYDTIRRSTTVFDRNFVRTSTIRMAARPSLVLGNGHYIASEQLQRRDLVGQPIHELAASGEVLSSYGSQDGAYRADQPLKFDRLVSLSSGGGLWSVAPGSLEFTLWERGTGRPSRHVRIRSNWFTPSLAFARPDQKPNPVILSFWPTSTVIWILYRVADRDWTSPEGARETVFTAAAIDSTYDFILEAVSIDSGLPIATRRFDRIVWGQPPLLRLVTRSTGSAGSMSLDVWQPELTTKGRE